jgi:streptomycin 6-kinase
VTVTLAIPDSLRAAIHFLRGEAEGDRWLARLPETWSRYARLWDLRLERILTGGQMSCCVSCRDADGYQLVLKIPVDTASGALEAAALRAWAGSGGAPLVRHDDPASGVFVMTFLPPAPPQQQTIEAVADLLDRLAHTDSPKPDMFPGLATNLAMRFAWADERFANPADAEGIPYLAPARSLAARLFDTTTEQRLLHGDLQLKNLHLTGDGRLAVIDPLPVVGDPHFDAAFWCVMQPGGQPIADTLEQLADTWTGCDPARLRDWAKIIAVAELRPYLADWRDRFRSFLDLAWPHL